MVCKDRKYSEKSPGLRGARNSCPLKCVSEGLAPRLYLVSSGELVKVLRKELMRSETFLELNLFLFGDDSGF